MVNPTPRIMILHATGSNRDREAAFACELAGGAPEIVHVNQVAAGERRLLDAQMLVLPGGFSYGDDLGAGKLWAVALRYRLGDELQAFVNSGRPVMGICNGFQVLVKAGLLPGSNDESGMMSDEFRKEHSAFSVQHSAFRQEATLTRNDSARFECRWVTLHPQAGSPCVFTQGLDQPFSARWHTARASSWRAMRRRWPGSSSRGWWRCVMQGRKERWRPLPRMKRTERATHGTPTARRPTSPASATRRGPFLA